MTIDGRGCGECGSGETTTAKPRLRPVGMSTTSPGSRSCSDAAASVRRACERAFSADFSVSLSSLRSAAYSVKSPRWQVMDSS